MKRAILPCVAIALLSLLPQINLWVKRGVEWHGTYATLHGDEFLYSAYLNALISGRPRRNDPFMGTDEEGKALPETTFSIQLVPSFVIASFARTVGMSAATSFIVLTLVASVLASLSIYVLLKSITGDDRVAAAGVLLVLCLGTPAGLQGVIGLLANRDLLIFGLPFLRRYQPAASFFLFFVFSILVYRALTDERSRFRRLWATTAGLTFAILVFSYLYLWTAAAAWVVCLSTCWLAFGPTLAKRRIKSLLLIVGAIGATSLGPYYYLVSNRSPTLDDTQTLISTHHPDLLRIPELIGLFVMLLLVVCRTRRNVRLDDPKTLFAVSFACLPLIVFNQQILTGRSMQPFHFEDFILNYVVLISFVLMVSIIFRPISQRALVWTAAFCFLWGLVEVNLPMRAYYSADAIKDDAVPVMLRLNQISLQEQSVKRKAVVFSPHSEIMLMLPTWAPQATLLGIGSLDFGTASQMQRKELFYLYLYYSAVDKDGFRSLLDGKTDDSFLKYYVRSAIFGHERVLPSLSFHYQPIKSEELEQATQEFERFTTNVTCQHTFENPISYLVTRAEHEGELSRIDQCYALTPPEHIGKYNLYRLILRPTNKD